MAKRSKSGDSRQRTVVKRAKITTARPPKPYDEFPLTAHPSGHWAKKIRGKLHYFGQWGKRIDGKLVRLPDDGWKAALDLYKEQANDLHAGRTPRVTGDGLTVADLCNRFYTAKKRQLDAGEIAARTFTEYVATTDRLVAAFGKGRLVADLAADDFESLRADIAKQWGPWRLAGEVRRVRTVFKYGYESGLMDKPVRHGPQFKPPSKSVMRKHRASNGSRMMEAADLQKLIDAASVQMKAMLMLALNCAFGNHDCAMLPLSAVDLKAGWIEFPRPKTGIDRRCPLWPETIDALKAAIAERPMPKDEADGDLVFITQTGRQNWNGKKNASPISAEFRKLASALSLHQTGRGFYSLRHVFRTVADATRDFPAVRLIMGHADSSIDDVYRERIDDTRLQAVTEHVRSWLWQGAKKSS